MTSESLISGLVTPHKIETNNGEEQQPMQLHKEKKKKKKTICFANQWMQDSKTTHL